MAKKKSKTVEAPNEHIFWLYNGGTLKNMEELVDALGKMDDATFRHHVNSEKNDFTNWIKDIFHQKALATSLKKHKDRKSFLKALKDKLKKK